MGRMKDIFIDLTIEDVLRSKIVFDVEWYSYDGLNWYKSALSAALDNIARANQRKAEKEEVAKLAEEERMRKCLW